MIGMQYKISLPEGYDMEIIRKRIQENGHKTDGFNGLLFKCYLIREKDKDGFENEYAPLYIWNDSQGMNQFVFDGFYDNIIKSFGWQNINIGIPLFLDLKDNFKDSKYVLDVTSDIAPQLSLSEIPKRIKKTIDHDKNNMGVVCIYNPDKWKYSMFYFYKERPKDSDKKSIYQILHLSEGK